MSLGVRASELLTMLQFTKRIIRRCFLYVVYVGGKVTGILAQ